MTDRLLDPDQVRRLTGVSRETIERLEAFVALLGRWQNKINLVSAASLDDVWRRHVLDSAQLAALLPGPPVALADIGSGAGFPGLVLAIMGVARATLIESDGRKCAFLEEAVRVSGADAEVRRARAETVTLEPRASAVTARAVAPLDKLVPLARRIAAPGAIFLFPKGRSVERELTGVAKTSKMRLERHPSIADPAGIILRLTEVPRG